MANDDTISFTEIDVKEPNLLFRLLRKINLKLTSLGARLFNLEKAPPPPTPQQLSRELQATGSAPLNVTALSGVLAQPQLAGAPRLPAAPSGLVLQQLKDTQLLLVGTTSTGYSLQAVQGGNPNRLIQLISGLSSSAVTSTSTNYMTLDTVQTVTTGGIKTVNAVWNYSSQGAVVVGSSTEAIQSNERLHIVGSEGPVATFPTINGRDYLVVENLGGANIALVKNATGGTYGLRGYTSASTGPVDSILCTNSNWALVSNTIRVFNASSTSLLVDLPTQHSDIITQYHGLNTAGEGVPYILARAAVTNQTSSTLQTTLYTTTTTGEYRLGYYIVGVSSGTSSVSFGWGWVDDVAGNGNVGPGVSLNSAGFHDEATHIVRSASGQPITYNVNMTSATSTSSRGAYSVYVILERLS